METYDRHIPSTRLRRVGASLTNALCFGLLINVYESLTTREANDYLFYFLCAFAVLSSVAFPESLGKRFCNLRILDAKKGNISLKVRLIRALPYLLLALSSAFAVLIENPAEVYVLAPVSGLSYLFIVVNGISIFFSRYGLSIMDRILKTQVMTPAPLSESLKPTFFGLKIR